MAEHPVLQPGSVAEAPLAVPRGGAAAFALLADGTLDPELTATIWRMLDARVPVIVASVDPMDGGAVQEALLGLLPDGRRTVELAGVDETFAWLPQAGELGQPGARPIADQTPASVRPETTVLVARRIAPNDPSATWGLAARIAVRAATIGYGLVATIAADSLEAVFAQLSAPPVALSDDEQSRLGVVLVLARDEGSALRVRAAHYVRPIARDEHGHVQRLGPAVLATWDPTARRYEHFGWGITPELARRVGSRAGDFELDLDQRRALLEAALSAARATGSVDTTSRDPDPALRG